MRPPRLWMFLCCDTFGLPPGLARAWWTALTASTWSESVTFRHTVVWCGHHGTPAQMLDNIWTPAGTVHILELLVQEGRLVRRTASAIEDLLCNTVQADGSWRRIVRQCDERPPLSPEEQPYAATIAELR